MLKLNWNKLKSQLYHYLCSLGKLSSSLSFSFLLFTVGIIIYNWYGCCRLEDIYHKNAFSPINIQKIIALIKIIIPTISIPDAMNGTI